ncbi:hypothetical protein BCR44DRAFT_1442925 [Catenaria anguillulae PL171]|uniref:C3H1-type domain-containing protein n=1 Tax=Catenaria anguillulae PL171 TaxID=765915 RepID=A0A1Y2HBX0_9FUNG|nr:hypothetical protein BCR44DRAFT_1442925 [Catenaria anguillulae PL171]
MAYPARDTLSQRQKRELAARQQEAQFRMASSGAAAAGEERDREYRHGGGPQRHHQHETGGGGGNRDRDRHQPASPVAPWKQNQHQQPARNFSPPPVGRAASPVRQAPPANTSAPASGSGWASLMTFNSAPPAPPAQAASQPPHNRAASLPATNKFGLPPAPSQRHQQQKQQQQQQHHQQQPAQKPSSALFAMFGGGGGADNRTSTMPNHMPAGTGQSPYPNQATHDDQRAVRGYKDLYGPNAGVGGGRAKPTFQCEPCDKTFPSASQLRSHLDTHVNCSQPQCTYQASQRAVKFHEMEAHGMHQEDGDQGEILLPAHIKLDTPEQIAQWIADRKKRYPTDANIAAKAADQQARLARGELPLASTSSALAAPLCRFIRNNQTCPHGANCKFRHALAPGELEADNAPGMYAVVESARLFAFMVNNRFFEFGVVWKSGLEDGPGARTWGAKPGEVHAEAEAEAAAEGEVKGEKVVGMATPGAGANVPDLETLRKQLLEAEHEDAMFYSDEEDHGMDVDDGQDNEGMADASSLDLIASLGGIRRRQSDGADDDVYADEGDDEYDRTPMVLVDNDDEQGDADQAEQSSSSDQEVSSEEEEA